MKWLKTNKSSRQKLQYQSCIAIASSFVRLIHLMWYTTWQFVQHIVIAKDCTFFLHIPYLLCSAILLCIDKHEQDRYSGTCNIVSGFSKKYRYCHICVVSWITMKEAWIQYYYQFSVIPCLVHYWKLLMGLFNSVMYFIDVITIMSVHGLVISVPRPATGTILIWNCWNSIFQWLNKWWSREVSRRVLGSLQQIHNFDNLMSCPGFIANWVRNAKAFPQSLLIY